MSGFIALQKNLCALDNFFLHFLKHGLARGGAQKNERVHFLCIVVYRCLESTFFIYCYWIIFKLKLKIKIIWIKHLYSNLLNLCNDHFLYFIKISKNQQILIFRNFPKQIYTKCICDLSICFKHRNWRSHEIFILDYAFHGLWF